ncbi:MAG: ArsR family transcriptional regulator [Halanaerobium sp. 4-GBenrich]|mgnify:CR=1 FL=1|jgi:DNA-binding transcriptional ArsR family regulator|uniref:DNA-binding transcriptional ArsR family regulator n=2 Tax=Halanaerobium TaxID=2330 RepID=A0A1G6K8B6_9FIRM|nr:MULTISPECIES: metalloregulator ArsR/SmtB family transcription factor [Halanaerobium]ODS50571.1 MAG: ArsR family transcriptional regulator [Halanaerobium sp. 4-GBenrich]PUU87974.1 MAG: ArsR family transcriptional regulator [Halanaerobium sp.]PTW01334.1 DNA-binding transcriptional ArsR family regulator [Halanaerobium saccharolyticum]PTX17701.1 DNA-binding transcriptional ArsR family regulator [Halanaerobium congolense]PUU90113.1 MAG: ArsR family transcriptional regulator [Halanaerobium sp.]
MAKDKNFCDMCEVFDPDEQVVNLMKDRKLQKNIVYQLSELFKTIGDPTRINILYALKDRELCVCDLSEILEMSSSAISHQLRVLRNNNLVKYRKEGRSVYYSLDDNHVLCLFGQGLNHVLED